MNPALAKVAAIAVAALAVGVPLALKRHVEPASAPKTLAAPTPVAMAPRPRFLDLGTTSCAPCKAMMKVMGDLEAKYPGALQIEFINTHDDPTAFDKYDVRVIPTQILFAPDGKELFRHVGVFPVDAISARYKELGYDLAALSLQPPDGQR